MKPCPRMAPAKKRAVSLTAGATAADFLRDDALEGSQAPPPKARRTGQQASVSEFSTPGPRSPAGEDDVEVSDDGEMAEEGEASEPDGDDLDLEEEDKEVDNQAGERKDDGLEDIVKKYYKDKE